MYPQHEFTSTEKELFDKVRELEALVAGLKKALEFHENWIKEHAKKEHAPLDVRGITIGGRRLG